MAARLMAELPPAARRAAGLGRCRLAFVLGDDLVAERDALAADLDVVRTGDHALDLAPSLAAERADALAGLCHRLPPERESDQAVAERLPQAPARRELTGQLLGRPEAEQRPF